MRAVSSLAGGLWAAHSPLCSPAWHWEPVATGVCPTCRATAALSPALLWGAHSGAVAAPWASARVLCEPRPCTGALSTSAKHIVLPVFPFFLRWLHAKLPRAQTSPSFLQPLPASAPGQLWANSPWHFLSGEQPLQPGTLVSSWQHSWGQFGLEMFVLGCWRVLDFVCCDRGCPERGRELRGSREPPVGATVLCLCSNIIDVSAADSQGMEQHEYMDRARQYR